MNLHNSCAWSLPIVSLRYSRRYRPCPREQLAACFNLMASCNGLFILRRIDGRSYYIENPAISKRVRLPRPTGRRWETMQVCHVPTSNQHKLVAGYSKLETGKMNLYILTSGEENWRRLMVGLMIIHLCRVQIILHFALFIIHLTRGMMYLFWM